MKDIDLRYAWRYMPLLFDLGDPWGGYYFPAYEPIEDEL
jgi:hypothetical protein